MEISFATKKLAKLLNSQKEMLRKYGPDNGSRILRKLSQLASAETLLDLSKLPATRLHELSNNRDEQLSLDIKHPLRLLMVPNHEETPRKPDGGLDWERVTAVTIIEIVDTHKS
jgi:plasmid maintenance system killer protein